MPLVRARGATMKAAQSARPHSGRTCAQSLARSCSERSSAGALLARWARPSVGARSARARWLPACRAVRRFASAVCKLGGTASVSNSRTSSVVVLCSAGRKWVVSGMTKPSLAASARTAGVLSRSARARALTSPVWPPQAPQSRPAACGLLAVWLPWPASITSGARSCVMPMAPKMALAMPAAAAGSVVACGTRGRWPDSLAFAPRFKPVSSQAAGLAVPGSVSFNSLGP